MADIFISYARPDRAVAERLAQALESRGISVWYDDALEGGTTFSKAIERELKAARKAIVLWSASAVDSRWVCDEATEALEQGKFVPVSIDGTPPPFGFRQQHTIDALDWAKGKGADLPAALQRVVGGESPARGAAEPGDSKPARDKRILFAGIAAALLALLGVGWFAFGPGGDGPLTTQSRERIPVLIYTFETSGSGDTDEAALASGITEELIQRLRRIPELQIATALPDGSAPSEAFASAHKVEGTIRKTGERYQATARLTGPSGEILWSDSFDFGLTDLLLLQEQLARNIAGALTVPLDVGANSRAYGGTDNPEAFGLYLQGRGLRFEDPIAAIRYIEQAIALDPGFVKAQALLARTYVLSLGRTASAQERSRILAKVDAASAAALDANPDLAESQLARASYLIATGDLKSAYAAVQRASELDPGIDVSLRYDVGTYTRMFGRAREAHSIMGSRELIDPSVRDDGATGSTLAGIGRFQEALDLYERTEAAGGVTDSTGAFWYLLMLGREDDAIALAREKKLDFLVDGLDMFERDPSMLQMELPELRRWADRSIDTDSALRLGAIAHLAAYRGHHKLAVDLLRIENERGSAVSLPMLWHPLMADARKTDAFVQLVTDLGLPEVWRESGNWGDFCAPKAGGGITCH